MTDEKIPISFSPQLPFLAFGRELREDDWFRVVKGFSGHGVCEEFHAYAGDWIYIYYHKGDEVRIVIFRLLVNSKRHYQGYWWVRRGKDKLSNTEYCVWLENKVDKRYK